MPCGSYSALSSATDLKVPSSLQFFPQGILNAPGTCPPRWQVSRRPGGERIFPVNSSGERTSTNAHGILLSTVVKTFPRRARDEKSGSAALYVFLVKDGTSADTGRPSDNHFFRPPSMMRAS